MGKRITGGVHLLVLILILAWGIPPRADAGEAIPRTLGEAPLQVRSWEGDQLLGAEIEATVDSPFAAIRDSLVRPESWCQFLPLVFNIKSCVVDDRDGRSRLILYVGRKFYETPGEAIRLSYRFQVRRAGDEGFDILLTAAEGPVGTRDYRIELAASPAGKKTSLRLHSSFRPSLRSRLATQAYLATSGRDKVGFSVRGYQDREPVYVDGVKGVIERNVMRYYLALKAFLDTAGLPEEERFEARLEAWYGMTEKYSRQLYEMDREEYLDAKRQERRHQQDLQENIG